jgi:hypothetical protein
MTCHGRDYVAGAAERSGFAVELLETEIHEHFRGMPRQGLVAALRRVS